MKVYRFIEKLDQFGPEEKKVLRDMFDECQFRSDVDSMLKAIQEKTNFYSASVGIVLEGEDYIIASRMIAGPRIILGKNAVEEFLSACRPYLEVD